MLPTTADRDDDTSAYREAQGGPAGSAGESWLGEAENEEGENAGGKSLSLVARKERDEFVRWSVRQLRMTVGQIYEFSKMWPHPFYSESDVWRRVQKLGLGNRIKKAAFQSLHDEWVITISTRIWRDAARNGITVSKIKKECSIGDGSQLRADMRFELGGKYVRYLEAQRSGLMYVGWKAKLTKWVNYRKKKGVKPFRVLIVLEDEQNLNQVLRYAKEVMEPYPDLTLFLFAWMPDLMGQYDCVTEDVFTTHRHEPIALY